MKLGPGQAPGYPTGKAVTVNDAYNAQMNLMVDMDDCKDAFKVFDPENTGTIVKDVSTNFHFFMKYLLPFDDFLMRAEFLKISPKTRQMKAFK